MSSRNVILTGIPRSGTTLACYLLNKLPNTVALFEPMDVGMFPHLGNHDAICEHIDRFFIETRDSLRNHGTAISKHINRKVPDNPIGNKLNVEGLRESLATKGPIQIEKLLTADFLLCIKHPSAFTAIVESLVKRYPCYAIIRNPLSVLASWNSVQFPVNKGHAPAAESLDTNLKSALGRISDTLGRQLYLLSWFYGKYRSALRNERVLRYEDIVHTRGRCLNVITAEANTLDEGLESKNKNRAYDTERMRVIAERLLRTSGEFWEFYTKDSVERLLA